MHYTDYKQQHQSLLQGIKRGEFKQIKQKIFSTQGYDEDPVLLHLAGFCCRGMRDYRGAIQLLLQSIELMPRGPSYFALGYAYRDLNEIDQAIEALSKGIEIYPGSVDAQRGLYRLLLKMNPNHTKIDNNDMLFTIIIATHNRFEIMLATIFSILNQTYRNIELVLINNGGGDRMDKLIDDQFGMDSRLTRVTQQYNVYNPLWLGGYLPHCYNEALKYTSGEYVWAQSDDDVLSRNYLEKISSLFRNNSKCTTAAGLPRRIDETGNIIWDRFDEMVPTNDRPRYMEGLKALHEQRLSTPGQILVVQRNALVQAGGLSATIETHELLSMLPFGETGYDPEAIFYWRNHPGQMNLGSNAMGILGCSDLVDYLHRYRVYERWRNIKDGHLFLMAYKTTLLLNGIFIHLHRKIQAGSPIKELDNIYHDLDPLIRDIGLDVIPIVYADTEIARQLLLHFKAILDMFKRINNNSRVHFYRRAIEKLTLIICENKRYDLQATITLRKWSDVYRYYLSLKEKAPNLLGMD